MKFIIFDNFHWNRIMYIIWSGKKKEKKKIWGRNDNGWVWEIGYMKEMKDYVAFIVQWKPMFVVFIVEWKP